MEHTVHVLGGFSISELCWRTAGQLAASIQLREVSSTEVVKAYLERIGCHNAAINAVVTIAEDLALRRAREADEALARGECWGPLHGVPVTIKDSIATAGIRTTSGFPRLRDYVPDEDATVVARLKAAGAIVLGKTNLSTLTIDCRSENPVFGQTKNPWDLSRTPGGSSGGSAAAVAAGLTPLDFGSDAGGSIRIPAHFCGVFGFKPTNQRVSFAGHIPDLPGAVRAQRLTQTIGPLSRSVDDLYLGLRLTAGSDSRDFDVPPVPVRSLPVATPIGLRVAWSPTLPGIPASAEVRQAVRGFALRVEGAGCRVDERCPNLDFEAMWQAFWQYQGMIFCTTRHFSALEDTVQGGSDVLPTVLDRMENLHKRDSFILTLERFFDQWDVLMLPAVMLPAFPLYEQGDTVPLDGVETDTGKVNNHCCLFNYTGHPAVVIPLTKSSDGMPIGLQLVGRRWHDEELLGVAKAFAQIAGPIGRPGMFA